jgi:hypothetical protein
MKLSPRPQKLRAALSRKDVGTVNDSSDHLYARVAALAYSFYEQRGREDGRDVEDWIQAEQTILAAQDGVAAKTEGTSLRAVTRAKAAQGKALLKRG